MISVFRHARSIMSLHVWRWVDLLKKTVTVRDCMVFRILVVAQNKAFIIYRHEVESSSGKSAKDKAQKPTPTR